LRSGKFEPNNNSSLWTFSFCYFFFCLGLSTTFVLSLFYKFVLMQTRKEIFAELFETNLTRCLAPNFVQKATCLLILCCWMENKFFKNKERQFNFRSFCLGSLICFFLFETMAIKVYYEEFLVRKSLACIGYVPVLVHRLSFLLIGCLPVVSLV